MKKNVFWLAAMAAAVSLTGCSVDEVVEKAEVRNIGFDAFANKSSRAENKLAASGHTNFAVWGRYCDDNNGTNPVVVFEKKEVSWNGSSWTYENPVPWVDSKIYEFAAVAPYNDAFIYDYTSGYTLGEITLDATTGVGDTYSNQTDYLVADVKENVASGTNPVSFTFNHIVSNIIFNFQPKITNGSGETTAWTSPVQIIIKKITLSNVLTNKKYENNTWSAAGSPNNGNFSKDLSDNNVTKYEPAGTSSSQVLEKLENKFSWFVVPQDNTTEASERKLTLTLDIKTQDATGAYNVVVKENATASVDIDTDWDANTQYTYTVYIGTDVLGQDAFITFDVEKVENWTTSALEDDVVPNP